MCAVRLHQTLCPLQLTRSTTCTCTGASYDVEARARPTWKWLSVALGQQFQLMPVRFFECIRDSDTITIADVQLKVMPTQKEIEWDAVRAMLGQESGLVVF